MSSKGKKRGAQVNKIQQIQDLRHWLRIADLAREPRPQIGPEVAVTEDVIGTVRGDARRNNRYEDRASARLISGRKFPSTAR